MLLVTPMNVDKNRSITPKINEKTPILAFCDKLSSVDVVLLLNMYTTSANNTNPIINCILIAPSNK